MQILGPIVFRPTIVVSSSRRSRHLEKKRGPVALYDDALDNEDAILSQKCLTFMINHYAALFRENPHRNLGILFSETSKLEEINMENIRRMEHQHMSIEKFKIRAVQRMYARFAMAKFFIAWRSVSATAEQRHSVYKKLHHLKQELEVTRAESLRAERRCTQLETKLDLETFDTNISTATFRKSIPRASAAFLLPVPSPGSRPSFIRQPSLSSPRPRTTTTFAF
ncbi:Rho-GAP domain-containing protein [Plasmodiophora brassicae]